ncbi:MAG: hypothetical protein II828_03620 [Clostridia bacterium]|nr:hypothetical protein [Clostridia bacterium]
MNELHQESTAEQAADVVEELEEIKEPGENKEEEKKENKETNAPVKEETSEVAEKQEKKEKQKNHKEKEKQESKEREKPAAKPLAEAERDDAERQAGYISGIAALVLTLVFYAAQYFLTGTTNYALCATVFGMLAAEKIVMVARIGTGRYGIFAALYGVLALCCGVLAFLDFLR